MHLIPRLQGLGLRGNLGGDVSTTLVLTCTTTGAQTLTLQGLTIAPGKTSKVEWGDNASNTYSGAGTRTHNYSGAGTWTVVINNAENVTLLDLADAKIGGTISASNPLPRNLTSLKLNFVTNLNYNVNDSPLPSSVTYLFLYNAPGVIYNVDTCPLPPNLTNLHIVGQHGFTYDVSINPLPASLIELYISGATTPFTYGDNAGRLPSGLTTLYFYNIPGATVNVNNNPLPTGLTTLTLTNCANIVWQIDGNAPWPVGVTTATWSGCPNISVLAWTNNSIRTIRVEDALTQAKVDATINAVWANKPNFTYATPLLDLLGGSNAAPSGVYQVAHPPTTGKEKLYDLATGAHTPTGPEWTVQYQA